jgi:hypothetical protein
MIICKRYIAFVMPILFLIQIASSQQRTSETTVVTSGRPLEEVANRLQEVYGKVVTYEEPLLTWREELQSQNGRSPEEKWQLFPKPQTFSMRAISPGSDLGLFLKDTIAAYHEQTSGTRFKVISSILGYHIVPVQAHDESGRLGVTSSILDRVITVPGEARTARGHLLTIGEAVNKTLPIRLIISAVSASPRGFDDAFRAKPGEFTWGIQNLPAREALIDLFNRSATSFSWQLKCQSSAQLGDRFCVLNVGLLEVEEIDSEGKPQKRVIAFDRMPKQ